MMVGRTIPDPLFGCRRDGSRAGQAPRARTGIAWLWSRNKSCQLGDSAARLRRG